MDLHSKMTMYVTSTMTSPVTKTAKTSKWLRLMRLHLAAGLTQPKNKARFPIAGMPIQKTWRSGSQLQNEDRNFTLRTT